MAKYLAKKLPKDSWVMAVDNGKVMFQKDGSSLKGMSFLHGDSCSFKCVKT